MTEPTPRRPLMRIVISAGPPDPGEWTPDADALLIGERTNPDAAADAVAITCDISLAEPVDGITPRDIVDTLRVLVVNLEEHIADVYQSLALQDAVGRVPDWMLDALADAAKKRAAATRN